MSQFKENLEYQNNSVIDASLYEEVRLRRALSFVADVIILALLCASIAIIIGLLGLVTIGEIATAWVIFIVVVPLALVLIITYVAMTMGGKKQATIGMAIFSIHIRRLDGKHVNPILAILHSILFWTFHPLGAPFMLIFSLFSSRKRLLQDWLLGTEVVRSDGDIEIGA